MVLRLVAEFSVIVFGVLIALSADGWVNTRTDRRVEATRVEALRDNVAETLLRLRSARADAEESRSALLDLAGPGYGSRPDVELDRLIREGLLYGPSFAPELNVYTDLKNSGELALLKNIELRQALAKMDAGLEVVRLHQEDVMTVQQLNYDTFVISRLDLVRLLGPFLAVEGLDSTGSWPRPPESEVRNLAVFKLDLVSELIAKYGDAEEFLTAVERAMGDREAGS